MPNLIIWQKDGREPKEIFSLSLFPATNGLSPLSVGNVLSFTGCSTVRLRFHQKSPIAVSGHDPVGEGLGADFSQIFRKMIGLLTDHLSQKFERNRM
jgi:hypothetical protein